MNSMQLSILKLYGYVSKEISFQSISKYVLCNIGIDMKNNGSIMVQWHISQSYYSEFDTSLS